MNRVRAGYPSQLDDLATLRREPADTVRFFPREVTVAFTTPRISNELPPLLTFKLAAGERFERAYPDSKSRVLPLDDPASRLQRYGFHAHHAQHRSFIDVMPHSPPICTHTIHPVAIVS